MAVSGGSGQNESLGPGGFENVGACPHSVHVRDSKVTDGPTFAVDPAAWTAFLGHATAH
ncbi:DUF397 domain-containing protein [Streptomyces sp. 2131.1]|uniref:DUF397 domain-containing protein n=1 Tax=Streptomyces sp. 2131.1 TaxID=1855346 RepID=UPI00210EACB3|nr:DUF397 domain-containing protein [Streptomyces sp. 2131.1]